MGFWWTSYFPIEGADQEYLYWEEEFYLWLQWLSQGNCGFYRPLELFRFRLPQETISCWCSSSYWQTSLPLIVQWQYDRNRLFWLKENRVSIQLYFFSFNLVWSILSKHWIQYTQDIKLIIISNHSSQQPAITVICQQIGAMSLQNTGSGLFPPLNTLELRTTHPTNTGISFSR